jgi:signal transduction histidine kinase
VHNGNGSFGLVGMRERAQQLNSDLVVNSRPGGGTEITFAAPAPS